MYTLLEYSARTSRAHRPLKIRDRIFQLITLRPRCGSTVSPKVPVVVELTLEELSPGTPHHNTIYITAYRNSLGLLPGGHVFDPHTCRSYYYYMMVRNQSPGATRSKATEGCLVFLIEETFFYK